MTETENSSAPVDLALLRSILERYAPQGRTALLPALIEAQQVYCYLPEPVAVAIGKALGVPLAELHGVIDYYSMLHREPVGCTVIRICSDPPCALAGSDALYERISQHLDDTRLRGDFELERAPCFGLCEHAPAVLMGETPIARADRATLTDLIQGVGESPRGIVGGDLRILTANCGVVDPSSLSDYETHGGFAALRKAVTQMEPADVIAEVKASNLVGRGGAAFPAGVKWESAATAPGAPKYVVCNADESEPGTFKDRVLMEEDPFRVLEGIVLCGYAISADKGYIYVRGEYPVAQERLRAASKAMRAASLLGESILGTGFSFDLEVRSGAGAYLCGEETALFESIEGKRGFPRVKPPFPTTHGLFGKPTVVNNVETLCNVPFIVERGASEYRQIGTQKSTGPKLYCVSGDVARPGLYEEPFGTTIRHLVFDLAGGLRQGRNFQAILFGGAAGAFATSAQLDVRMSFEDLRAAGLPLGSGVVMVFDDTRDIRAVLLRLSRFFAEESCGKCYPCQLGTQRQFEILQRVAAGRTLPGDTERLADVGWTMTDASLCGLGQTAASAVLSAMKLWPEKFVERKA
jgi:NADH-quinone oxidoreductase subunit F